MTRKGKEFQELAQIGLGFIFTIYGFFAFTQPEKYPILHISQDKYLGIILLIIGIYIVFFKRR